MDTMNDISTALKQLIDNYGFNLETLASYLALDMKQIQQLAIGDLTVLPDESKYRFEIYNKILFVAAIPAESKDMKLSAFLRVLLSCHHLSKATIAKMAGVEKADIENILSLAPKAVSYEAKYKVAVTVMALRFFLKETATARQL